MPALEKITPALAAYLKEARLSAFKDAPGALGSTYAKASQLSEAEWLNRASAMSYKNAIGFLVLDEGQPCGIVRGKLDEANPLCTHRLHVGGL